MLSNPNRILRTQKLIGQKTPLAMASKRDFRAIALLDVADDQVFEICYKSGFTWWISVIKGDASQIFLVSQPSETRLSTMPP
ncbi:hypothetical protein MITS9504_01698 [Synechococcus sp. MIT S9504]|nr:hypothetical protein MITS9504_01698 [Synechococcus sp. MIT S9504]